jgi:predicted house-cleaning noncanonical NTP pyrophosphatase (MazG superfamily)
VRVEYHKLVRDSIPDIIRRSGSRCAVVAMAEEEYRRALREKLVEEASEAAAAEGDHLVAELADLCEVMDALMASYGISAEAVRAEQERRRAARGGFAQRLCLLWTESDAQG